MLEILESSDIQFFLYLNSFHSDFWDAVMVFFSKKTVWAPLYLSIAYWLYRKFGLKKMLLLLVFYALLITLADQISLFLKLNTHRFRPYHEVRIADVVYYVKKSGGQYGFVSGHAANSVAFAVFSALVIRHKSFSIFILTWAFLVSYSRIYLAAHYPGDVLGGMILGYVIARLVYKLYLYVDKKMQQREIYT